MDNRRSSPRECPHPPPTHRTAAARVRGRRGSHRCNRSRAPPPPTYRRRPPCARAHCPLPFAALTCAPGSSPPSSPRALRRGPRPWTAKRRAERISRAAIAGSRARRAKGGGATMETGTLAPRCESSDAGCGASDRLPHRPTCAPRAHPLTHSRTAGLPRSVRSLAARRRSISYSGHITGTIPGADLAEMTGLTSLCVRSGTSPPARPCPPCLARALTALLAPNLTHRSLSRAPSTRSLRRGAGI